MHLFTQFQHSVNWNAFFYTTYKMASTLLTLFLYRHLTTKDFSVWANMNSMIFLILLWIDCGFRKSIPRYCPEFAGNHCAHRGFIRYIIMFQISILLLSTPFFLFVLTKTVNIIPSTALLILGGLLFFIEGLLSLMRLIFHAHFWHKQFNLVSTAIMFIEIVTNLTIIIYIPTSYSILKGIFITKLIASAIIVAISLYMLKKRNEHYSYNEKTIDTNKQWQEFIKHSGFMWVNNNLKSLTERNFLVPLLTNIAGPAQANLFKVANDGALLFYRTIVKTIGTTDTALFAHVETVAEKKKLAPIAFQKVATKITSLCLPLLGILLLLFLLGKGITKNILVFQSFFIITIGYLLESILSPYERVLEVKRCYTSLFIAYIPYISTLVIMFTYFYSIVSLIGLLGMLIIIHGVRLVSSACMVYAASQRFDVKFPLQFVLGMTALCVGISLVTWLICISTPLGCYVCSLLWWLPGF